MLTLKQEGTVVTGAVRIELVGTPYFATWTTSGTVAPGYMVSLAFAPDSQNTNLPLAIEVCPWSGTLTYTTTAPRTLQGLVGATDGTCAPGTLGLTKQ